LIVVDWSRPSYYTLFFSVIYDKKKKKIEYMRIHRGNLGNLNTLETCVIHRAALVGSGSPIGGSATGTTTSLPEGGAGLPRKRRSLLGEQAIIEYLTPPTRRGLNLTHNFSK
jgi:hypothetical protein